jgi:hypothetical protein
MRPTGFSLKTAFGFRSNRYSSCAIFALTN